MKISIVTVCFNSEKTIEKTIKSIISQTYKEIEYIVIDGNSNDDTLNIIHKYKNHVDTLISEPDNGLYDAMNKGIKLANGEVVGILNSDDLYTNDNVIKNIMSYFNNDSVDLVYGNIKYFKNDDVNTITRNWRSSKFISGSFLKGWHPPHPALFVRKKVYNLYGVFDLNFEIASDFDLMLRFFEYYKLKSLFIDKSLVLMRAGGVSGNLEGVIKTNRERRKSFKKYNFKINKFYAFYVYYPKIKELIKNI